MSNKDIAVTFVTSFCRGDISGIESTLNDKFSLEGPLFTFDSRDKYLGSLRRDPPVPAKFDIIEILEGDEAVSIYYAYKKPSGTVIVSQLFWFRDGKISKMLLVFDRASAA